MLLCVAVFFSGLVNFEVRFLFYVGAFGESLFACPKSNPKGQPKPIAPRVVGRPAHNSQFYW
jgi:hypothetical protein